MRLIVIRMGLAVPTLFVLTIVAYAITLLVPGDAATAAAGEFAPPEVIERIRADLALDRPVVVRYLDWLGGVLHGDFGSSIRFRVPVHELIAARVGPTLWLAGTALVASVVVSIVLGSLAAARVGSWVDNAITAATSTALAIPDFLMGALLIYVMSVRLRWLPSSGYVSPIAHPIDGARSLLLPCMTLALTTIPFLTRMMRASMIEVLGQDFIRTARVKGLSLHLVVRRHAIKNSMVSTATTIGLVARQLVGGAVVVETLFAVPGMGALLANSVIAHDFPVVQALVLYIGVGVIVVNAAIDASYAAIDKRVRVA